MTKRNDFSLLSVANPLAQHDHFHSHTALAKLFASTLDAKLADGLDPLTSSLTITRAQQLGSLPERQALANSWLSLLDQVHDTRVVFSPAIPIQRRRVSAAKAQIHVLARALVRPLANVRGVAMALTILRDGSGPLFNPYSERSLADLLDQVIDLVNPLSSAYR
ncbi:MAG: hypothetical protein WA359_06370 [Acidimicrobiales bacterium]